ncbi:PAS/PAC sensor signal transduction histidine kinase [Desulfofarcimen acetoxidans DSM 771]|jgi:two-component system phosphate regulon sensor histidine kinase PhoR|uniref:Phosphate regulon sensor protein PhoR n=1 Tax=Desulfofarcimen acetoxidans (strain ATCC 49208 / DSM 771 / KCTC 5769 / VKM B-1644 / 5575) TaxID=485916 RepID=C8W496_DESAS|nr:phosphate regulon sensor histidine kinase PhoR [Desulfofarcimen acetoxidans]ACV61964.1 PAS/PAC sensor signal transduction histidine kinase [Desulfofarcimen acetoxidans DSM 771]
MLLKGVIWRAAASYFILLAVFWGLLELYKAQLLTFAGAFLTASLLSVVFAWLLYKRVINPLAVMSEVTQEMARGNFDQQIIIRYQDEIGELAANINNLAGQLKTVITDITTEKNRARAILDSMADGVIALDREGKVLLVNPAVEDIFAIENPADQVKNILGIIRNYELEQLLFHALKRNEPMVKVLKILTSEEPRVFRVHLTPLRSSDTKTEGIVAVLRDITDRRKLEQMRTEFVANVSHELRTPLTSISGFLETLLDGALEEPEIARRFLEHMSDETERLTRLINDLLNLSNIEDRQFVPNFQPVDMAELIHRVAPVYEPRAREKGLTLMVTLSPNLPPVIGDEDLLMQVLTNLIDNAIKYTPAKGKIEIKARASEQEMKVIVTDTGIGIPTESLARIFERFYRVDKARSREMGGTGLGLSIVKHIVERHGGSLEVTSTVGKGSIFAFILPVAGDLH